MRKLLLIGLLFAGACQSRTSEAPVTVPMPVTVADPAGPGAVTPRLAVDGFLASVRAGDLQAMSGIWGDKNGPVRDSKIFSRQEMEQRELILIRCFKHDSFRVLGESPAVDGERVFQVELRRGTLSRVTDFFTAKGGDRWYMRYANPDPMKEFCSAK